MNVEDLYRLLRTSHIQAQGIVDTIAEPLLVLDESLRVQAASRSFFEIFKVERDETIGQPVWELGNGQWNIPDLRLLLAQVIPRSSTVINYQVEHDFPNLGRRIMLVTARRLFHPDNNSCLILLSIVDATESVHELAAKDMLSGELRHRMKNLLGLAQSLARQTTTEGRSAAEYRDDFLGRFGALVEAQDIAFSKHEDSDLKLLIRRILAPYTSIPEAVVIEPGPAVVLGPQMITSLGLVLHELATNAAKHGALSARGGQVRVRWQVEDAANRLRLRWVESGGPPVHPPATMGYGTRLMHSAMSYSLGGEVQQNYELRGLATEIVIPLGKASPPD